MESSVICLDTSILIDFFRKKRKENSVLYKLSKNYDSFVVSVITEYEIYVGSTDEQNIFWEDFFENITILPFDSETRKIAVGIYKSLKTKNRLIEVPDIFIGATAMQYNYPLATFNTKHFKQIEDLRLISF